MLRSLLTYLGLTAPAIDVLAQLDAKLIEHSREARRVEARALVRKMKTETDPNRGELRRIDAERRDTILRRFGEDEESGRSPHGDAINAAFQRRRDR